MCERVKATELFLGRKHIQPATAFREVSVCVQSSRSAVAAALENSWWSEQVVISDRGRVASWRPGTACVPLVSVPGPGRFDTFGHGQHGQRPVRVNQKTRPSKSK